MKPAYVLLCLAGLLLGCGTDSDSAATGPPNIILVSIDSLRPDHLGCYGYDRETSPFLDSLAAGGVRFENALSSTSWTLPAHASMFTGLVGATHALVDNGLALSEDHLTLAELLRAEGYHTAGFFGGPYLHPTFGLAQGFDVYRSCMSSETDALAGEALRLAAKTSDGPSHHFITGPRTGELVARWSAKRASQARPGPFFLFLHMWDVHYDFNPPDAYRRQFVDPNYEGPADGRLMTNPAIKPEMSAADLQHVIDLYDAEIRFNDSILRDIFADLKAKGLLEKTLVVVTSDHGEEFFEHGNRGHNKTLFDEVLRVPLVVHWPGELQRGRVISDQVQLIDLFPTLASFAGFEGDLPTQGGDLSPLLAGRAMKAREALSGLFIDGGSLRALRSRERKVLRVQDGSPAVYVDLRAHPDEKFEDMIYPQTPHSQKKRERAEAQLADAVRRAERLRELLGKRPPDSIQIPESMRRELSALGYLEGDQ